MWVYTYINNTFLYSFVKYNGSSIFFLIIVTHLPGSNKSRFLRATSSHMRYIRRYTRVIKRNWNRNKIHRRDLGRVPRRAAGNFSDLGITALEDALDILA